VSGRIGLLREAQRCQHDHRDKMKESHCLTPGSWLEERETHRLRRRMRTQCGSEKVWRSRYAMEACRVGCRTESAAHES
jgi:hypothetical protein